MNLNDYPSEQPQKISWKFLLIVFFGVVLGIVIVIVVAKWIAQNKSHELVRIEEEQQVQSEIALCKQSKDSEACEAEIRTEIAVNTFAIDVCEPLETEARENCIWLTAIETKDASLCAQLKTEGYAIRCADGIYRTLAAETRDQSYCEKIEHDEKQQGCEELFIGPLTAENCVERKKNPAICEFLRVTERATAAQDRAICNELADDYDRLSCADFVLTDDPDFDELSSSSEMTYGTDPRNPDTDGDGYEDGAEVEAGYNPNGAGKLNE